MPRIRAQHLVYYANEQARHPDLLAKRLTFREARRITKMLALEHGVPLAKVCRPRRGRPGGVSWFSPRRHIIVYNERFLCLLVVLHEFAHALDYKLRPVWHRGRRWHCNAHKELVDDLAAVARARGWLARIPAPPRPRIRLPLNLPAAGTRRAA